MTTPAAPDGGDRCRICRQVPDPKDRSLLICADCLGLTGDDGSQSKACEATGQTTTLSMARYSAQTTVSCDGAPRLRSLSLPPPEKPESLQMPATRASSSTLEQHWDSLSSGNDERRRHDAPCPGSETHSVHRDDLRPSDLRAPSMNPEEMECPICRRVLPVRGYFLENLGNGESRLNEICRTCLCWTALQASTLRS